MDAVNASACDRHKELHLLWAEVSFPKPFKKTTTTNGKYLRKVCFVLIIFGHKENAGELSAIVPFTLKHSRQRSFYNSSVAS